MQKLLDLSGKIDDLTVEALLDVANRAGFLKIPFFVVGAAARDFILQYGYDIEINRATQDLDIGVQVIDWKHFEKLVGGLIATGKFAKGEAAQRLIYKSRLPIDIIPFGPIADPDNLIKWPPGREIEMSTLGFRESYKHSTWGQLKSNPSVKIRFASLCGLTAMKLISWNEKYPERTSDARDLELITRNYIEAGNMERVYDGKEADISEDENFDYELASARLLGRDLASILNPVTKEKILKIFKKETGEQTRYRLVEDMRRGYPHFRNDFEEKLNLLEALKKGFSERY